ncbi:MAG: DNA polymerase I [Candidatus Poribacteria bacterium]|nr:DNA polymerase I [Candidatus Poribacteria bacterium]
MSESEHSSAGRLFLIDGMALIYRGFHAMKNRERRASTGLYTSALFVCANTIQHILDKENPTHIAVAMDTPEPTHRHEMYEEYKAHRENMPENLEMELPYIDRLFESYRIPILKMPGYEADDVIGTLAARAEKENFETYMVTPDKDFEQMVSDRVFVYKPRWGGGGYDIVGKAEVREKWAIERSDQVRDMLALMGDSSDNVPGVPGIGIKTAQKLIGLYGSVEGLLENVDQLKGKQKENVETHAEKARLSKTLVTIDREAPVETSLKALERREIDKERLKQLFVEVEFRTLGKRMFGDDFEAAVEEEAPPTKTIDEVEHAYELADTEEKRAALIERIMKADAVCFDLETTGLNARRCDIVGAAFSMEPKTGAYMPFPHERDEYVPILEQLRPFFQSDRIQKIGHNLKYDMSVLAWHGMEVRGPVFDTMLAAHLATPELRRSMDYLSEALLGYKPVSISTLIGERGSKQKSMREVPVEQVKEYAVEDADIALQLRGALEPRLKEMKQEQVFYEVECPLVAVLASMEKEGIRLDASVLERLSEKLGVQIRESEARIYDLAGENFNMNSPKQVGEVLFGKMKIVENAKRTRTGQYQTSERILSRLAPQHEIVRQILEYREALKLKSVYVDTLPHTVDKNTGRVHTHYEQAVTATGRMQSSGPNLQNIPVRTPLGQEIRKAFVPRSPDFALLSADYSQIELRLAAELSQDEAMLAAFQNGEDIHSSTAARIYSTDLDGVTREMRDKAKMVNFGILYGISAFGLSQRLNAPKKEAGELIDNYFAQFPGIRRYMDETVEFAKEHGYVETIKGRRRYLRDINSANATQRGAAERNAINSRIQGSAADMIKIAMSRIHREMSERGLETRMLLQVHDELVFDMRLGEEEIVKPLIEKAMAEALPVSVPIVVEMGVGDNWLEAH